VRLKRICWLMWLHSVDAFVTRLDRVMDTPPGPTTWVPEARPAKTEEWEDADA